MYLPGGGGEEHSEIVLKKETTRAISVAVAEKIMTSFFVCVCFFLLSLSSSGYGFALNLVVR